mgnify:CR=1 FL=1
MGLNTDRWVWVIKDDVWICNVTLTPIEKVSIRGVFIFFLIIEKNCFLLVIKREVSFSHVWEGSLCIRLFWIFNEIRLVIHNLGAKLLAFLLSVAELFLFFSLDFDSHLLLEFLLLGILYNSWLATSTYNILRNLLLLIRVIKLVLIIQPKVIFNELSLSLFNHFRLLVTHKIIGSCQRYSALWDPFLNELICSRRWRHWR